MDQNCNIDDKSQLELSDIANIRHDSPIKFTSISECTNWEDLKHILSKCELFKLSRKKEVTAQYKKFTARLHEQGIDTSIQIERHVFGFGGSFEKPTYMFKELEYDSQKYMVCFQAAFEDFEKYKWLGNISLQPLIMNISPASNLVMITENAFPYNLSPAIHHWLMWANHELSDSLLKAIVSELELHCEYMLHVNPLKYRSVLHVFHAHLFINFI